MTHPKEIALFSACQTGDVNSVQALINSGNVDVNDEEGPPDYYSPIDHAIDNANNESNRSYDKIIKLLVKHSDINQKNLSKALVYFARTGDVANFEFCLNKGADVNYSHDGDTALTQAIKEGHQEIINLLFHQGEKLDVNVSDYMNETPLILSIRYDNKEAFVKIISNLTLNLSHQSYLYGTAITAAIFLQRFEMANILIDLKDEFNIEEHPGAFNWAIRHENIPLVKKLYEKSKNSNNGEFNINSKFSINYDTCDHPIPDWLNINPRLENVPLHREVEDSIFEPPINIALLTKNPEMVKQILEYEPNLTCKGEKSVSALTLSQSPDMPADIKEQINNYIKQQQKKGIIYENSPCFFKLASPPFRINESNKSDHITPIPKG